MSPTVRYKYGNASRNLTRREEEPVPASHGADNLFGDYSRNPVIPPSRFDPPATKLWVGTSTQHRSLCNEKLPQDGLLKISFWGPITNQLYYYAFFEQTQAGNKNIQSLPQ